MSFKVKRYKNITVFCYSTVAKGPIVHSFFYPGSLVKICGLGLVPLMDLFQVLVKYLKSDMSDLTVTSRMPSKQYFVASWSSEGFIFVCFPSEASF